MQTRIPSKFFLIGIIAVCFGCHDTSYMPLEQGREWKYLVSTSSGSSVASLAVIEKARVGLTTGWRISGEKGDLRLAWNRQRLVASELSAAQFDPPITLIKTDAKAGSWKWHGTIRSRGFEAASTAECLQQPDRIKIAGNERACLLTIIRLQFRGNNIELRSWFQDGIGIVRQEQRVDDKLIVALEWIGGS